MTALETTPVVTQNGQRRPSHYCSLPRCGRHADAIHLVDNVYGGYPRYGVTVEFSCPRHDAGGYVIPLDQYEIDRDGWLDHLAAKVWRGDLALEWAGLA